MSAELDGLTDAALSTLRAERGNALAALRRHQGCAAKTLAEVPESLPREEQSFAACENLCAALQFIERDSEEVLAGRVGPSGLLEIERLRARITAMETVISSQARQFAALEAESSNQSQQVSDAVRWISRAEECLRRIRLSVNLAEMLDASEKPEPPGLVREIVAYALGERDTAPWSEE